MDHQLCSVHHLPLLFLPLCFGNHILKVYLRSVSRPVAQPHRISGLLFPMHLFLLLEMSSRLFWEVKQGKETFSCLPIGYITLHLTGNSNIEFYIEYPLTQSCFQVPYYLRNIYIHSGSWFFYMWPIYFFWIKKFFFLSLEFQNVMVSADNFAVLDQSGDYNPSILGSSLISFLW